MSKEIHSIFYQRIEGDRFREVEGEMEAINTLHRVAIYTQGLCPVLPNTCRSHKQQMETTYLVVKDDTGVLRPMAGIWTNNEHGKASAENFIKKDSACSVVEVKIVEV